MIKVEELIYKGENEIKQILKKIIVDKSLEFDWDDLNLKYHRVKENSLFETVEEYKLHYDEVDEILDFYKIASETEDTPKEVNNIVFNKVGNDLLFCFRDTIYIFNTTKDIKCVLEHILEAINVIRIEYIKNDEKEQEKENFINDFFNIKEEKQNKEEKIENREIINKLI